MAAAQAAASLLALAAAPLLAGLPLVLKREQPYKWSNKDESGNFGIRQMTN